MHLGFVIDTNELITGLTADEIDRQARRLGIDSDDYVDIVQHAHDAAIDAYSDDEDFDGYERFVARYVAAETTRVFRERVASQSTQRNQQDERGADRPEAPAQPEVGVARRTAAGSKESDDADAVPRLPLVLTKITATVPKTLSKIFKLDANGGLIKQKGGGQLSEGIAERLELATPQDAANMLAALTPSNALMHGVFPADKVVVASRKKAQSIRGRRELPIYTRTTEETAWAAAPGLMMIDYDLRDGFEPMSATAIDAEICEAVGSKEYSAAPRIYFDSASSYIYRQSDGEALRGSAGKRIYICVRDATDIERAASVLVARLWLAGKGFILISKSGAMLERTVVDASVWQASRLDFAGGAFCHPGLEQRRPPPTVINGEADWLDTKAALPNLTGDERKRLTDIIATARQEKEPEAKAQRERWIAERVAADMASCAETDAAKRDEFEREAEAKYRAALMDGRLFGDFELVAASGEIVTVGQVLDNPDKWHNTEFSDPIERDYDGGRPVAWANLHAKGSPFVHSHAHGGRTYRLIRARQTILLTRGSLEQRFERTMNIVRANGLVFQRDNLLVRVYGSKIVTVRPEWLQLHLARTIRFEQLTKPTEKNPEPKPVIADVPPDLPRLVIGNEYEWALPELARVCDAPTIDLRDGRIIAEEGMDVSSKLFVNLSGKLMRPILDTVGLSDAEKAVEALWRPFKDFPFSDRHIVDDGESDTGAVSRGIYLALLLTTVSRPLLPTAPAFLLSSNCPGSGKTLLSLCAGRLSSGGIVDLKAIPEGGDEEETKKMLFSALLEGAPSIIIDNVSGVFRSNALCSMLTGQHYSDRVLGMSKTTTVPTTSTFILSGNKPSLGKDLARRVLTAELNAGIENPALRRFDVDPFEYVTEHRIELIRAGLVILKAWHNAGRPRFTNDSVASYALWADTVRQAVLWVRHNGWLDVADPVGGVAEGGGDDPEVAAHGAFLQACVSVFGCDYFHVSELVQIASDPDRSANPISVALADIGALVRGEVKSDRLSYFFRAKVDAIADGLVLRRKKKDTKSKKSAQWRVEIVEDGK